MNNDIIKAAQQNDINALDDVFNQAKKLSRTYIRNRFPEIHKTIAEDLSHDHAVHVLLNLEKFDPERGAFRNFVCAIAHNKTLSVYSSKRHRIEKVTSSLVERGDEDDSNEFVSYTKIVDTAPTPEQLAETRDAISRINELYAFAGKDEELIRTYFNESLTSKEASERFNIPDSSVRIKILRFRKKIKHLKQEYCLN